MSLALLAWAGFGIFVGAYGTLVGAGGGFLVVPALLWIVHAEPAFAAGTSLAVVLFNACSGTVAYARRGLVDWRTALLFAAATVPGSLLGPGLVQRIPERAFQEAFGVLLVAISAWLMLRPGAPSQAASHRPTRRALAWGMALSFGVGFLSSMLGIGGGVIHVPVLIYALGFPAHLAIATSHATLAMSAGVGVCEHARLGHVVWAQALPMGCGALAGAQLGAWLSQRTRIPLLIRALGLAIALVGLRCLWVALYGAAVGGPAPSR